MNRDATGTLTEIAAVESTERAIVIGAGMGGLLAARAVADHYPQVVVLDRDTLPGSPEHRKNIPQGQHVHALLARGRSILESFFPGITADLVRAGALLADKPHHLTWHQNYGYMRDAPSVPTVLVLSRPFLEYHLRQRVASLPNVEIIDDTRVTGLTTTRDRGRVTGVRFAFGDTAERELGADLVIDASGRGSRLPQWLEQMGYAAPERVSAGVDARYATRMFRREPGSGTARLATVIVPSGEKRRGGVMLAQEGDRWLVTLSGRNGIQPPTELDAFIAYAGSLEVPDIHEVVQRATPLDDGVIYRFPQSQRRLYERLESLPAGLLPFGDAICGFNPVYAQGMSIAAIEAEHLRSCLAAGTGDLARRFLASITTQVDAAWKLAAAGDLRYVDQQVALPRPARFINWYMAKLLAAAHHDGTVAGAFHMVTNLIDSPQRLMRPSIALRVALASVRHPAPSVQSAAPVELASSPAD